jgi:hypothetical protein
VPVQEGLPDPLEEFFERPHSCHFNSCVDAYSFLKSFDGKYKNEKGLWITGSSIRGRIRH